LIGIGESAAKLRDTGKTGPPGKTAFMPCLTSEFSLRKNSVRRVRLAIYDGGKKLKLKR